MIKYLVKLIFFIVLIFLSSCDSNENSPFSQNHHRLEFDIIDSTQNKKRVGVSNLEIYDSTEVSEVKLVFNLIHKGIITIVSPECEISIQEKFDSKFVLNLEEIYKHKKSCSYLIIAESKNNTLKDFALMESAILNIVYKKENLENIYISVTNRETQKNYHFTNEGSLQLRSSFENSETIVKILTSINEGSYEITGCSKFLNGEFKNKTFDLNLQKFFKTKKILKSDSCLINIKIFNKKLDLVSNGFLYINIFDAKTVLTKKLNFKIMDDKLEIMGNAFEVICSINDSYLLYSCREKNVTCDAEYEPDKLYWIRGITPLGRKSVYGLINGKIIWEE